MVVCSRLRLKRFALCIIKQFQIQVQLRFFFVLSTISLSLLTRLIIWLLLCIGLVRFTWTALFNQFLFVFVVRVVNMSIDETSAFDFWTESTKTKQQPTTTKQIKQKIYFFSSIVWNGMRKFAHKIICIMYKQTYARPDDNQHKWSNKCLFEQSSPRTPKRRKKTFFWHRFQSN